MICKGNFDGKLVNGCNGEVEEFDGYCVLICENENEWDAIREAMRYQIMHLKKISKPGPIVCDLSNEIYILERMYKETD